jgi:hypothetical protein
MTAKVITVANQKGGTGKTTSLVSVSGQLAATNHKVLAVDLDPQGNVSVTKGLPQEPGAFNLLVNYTQDPMQWVRMTGRKNLDVIPGDRSTASAQILLNAENRPMDAIRQALLPLLPHYHYIFIDTAPSVGGIQERAGNSQRERVGMQLGSRVHLGFICHPRVRSKNNGRKPWMEQRLSCVPLLISPSTADVGHHTTIGMGQARSLSPMSQKNNGTASKNRG